jgi:hypothetical protein
MSQELRGEDIATALQEASGLRDNIPCGACWCDHSCVSFRAICASVASQDPFQAAQEQRCSRTGVSPQAHFRGLMYGRLQVCSRNKHS